MKNIFLVAILLGCAVGEAKQSRIHTGVVLDNEQVKVWNTYYQTGVKACRLEKASGNYTCSFSRYENGVVWCDTQMQPKGCQFDPYGPMQK